MASRTLPGLGLNGFWAAGEDGWKPGMDANLLKLSVLSQGKVISRTTALPGSPTDGDIYIVPSGAGANPNEIAVRDNGAWTYFVPVEGDMLYVTDDSEFAQYDGSAWNTFSGGGGGGGDLFTELSFFAGGGLENAEVLFSHIAGRAYSLPAGLTGSFVKATAAATAEAVLSIRKNGVEVGTATFAASGTVATLALASLTSMAVEDVLSVVAPATADSTLADVSATLLGDLT